MIGYQKRLSNGTDPDHVKICDVEVVAQLLKNLLLGISLMPFEQNLWFWDQFIKSMEQIPQPLPRLTTNQSPLDLKSYPTFSSRKRKSGIFPSYHRKTFKQQLE